MFLQRSPSQSTLNFAPPPRSPSASTPSRNPAYPQIILGSEIRSERGKERYEASTSSPIEVDDLLPSSRASSVTPANRKKGGTFSKLAGKRARAYRSPIWNFETQDNSDGVEYWVCDLCQFVYFVLIVCCDLYIYRCMPSL